MQSLKQFREKLYAEITEVPELLRQSHLPSLDGLRAVSILYVIVAHINFRYYFPYVDTIFQGGKLGVQIFFVISGFLITTLLLKEKVKTGTISLRKFYIRRFLRIIPVAYLYLVMLLLLNYFLELNVPVGGIIASFFFVKNIPTFQFNWFTEHYWSLAVEEQFYLIFPSILKRNLKTYINFLLIAFVSIVLLRQFDFLFPSANEIQNPVVLFLHNASEVVIQFDGIIIGSLLSILTFKNLLPINFILKYKIILNLLFVPIIITLFRYSVSEININPTIASILIGVILISNLYPAKDFIFKILNNKLMNFIGVLSYSIYIWQQLFTVNEEFAKNSSQLIFYTMPYNLILLFAIAFISYNFYEKKFLKLKDKFK